MGFIAFIAYSVDMGFIGLVCSLDWSAPDCSLDWSAHWTGLLIGLVCSRLLIGLVCSLDWSAPDRQQALTILAIVTDKLKIASITDKLNDISYHYQ